MIILRRKLKVKLEQIYINESKIGTAWMDQVFYDKATTWKVGDDFESIHNHKRIFD
jgi:hypothetical protein